ncbi:ubiquitin protein ligase 5 [Striga asiatica]|uniref:Ubiquitin protein ligase 5 n=1 Tax=Striga asiatica TaxID=4170 RepID=A0A5A7PQ55_STRAF|nr:ubiquitin protein ligase 5 [Striga asiatica]
MVALNDVVDDFLQNHGVALQPHYRGCDDVENPDNEMYIRYMNENRPFPRASIIENSFFEIQGPNFANQLVYSITKGPLLVGFKLRQRLYYAENDEIVDPGSSPLKYEVVNIVVSSLNGFGVRNNLLYFEILLITVHDITAAWGYEWGYDIAMNVP